MTKTSHYWAYTLRKSQRQKVHVPQCSLQHCLQQPGHASNLDVRMDKGVVYTYNGIVVIKGNAFESVLVTWMNLEPVIESEMSEREKQILYINMESRKMALMNFFAGKEWRCSFREWTQ